MKDFVYIPERKVGVCFLFLSLFFLKKSVVQWWKQTTVLVNMFSQYLPWKGIYAGLL